MSSPAIGSQDARPISPCQKFEGHTEPVKGVIHLPGGQQIMTYSKDGSLRVWDLQTGKQISNWRDGEGGMSAIALSPDGKKVISGSWNGAVRLWNLDAGKVIAKWTGHTGKIVSVCWNRDCERVMSGSRMGR
jgi:WD40 repeat protein